MNNNPATPYCLSLQSVLNEFSKYAIKLSEASELGIKHSNDTTQRVNTEGLKMSQELKAIVLAPEFATFQRRLDPEVLNLSVVLARPHGISVKQSTYKTAYELASMSLMLSNTCLMKEGEYQPRTAKHRVYKFLKDLCRKIYDLSVKMLGFLNGAIGSVMSHFLNSISHEIDARGEKDDG